MRHVRIAVVLGTVAMLVVGLAGPAAAKTVSAKKYAKSVCAIFGTYNGLVDAYSALPVDDVPTFHAQTVELLNEYVSDLQAGEAKLKKLTPDVDGGKKITRALVGSLAEQAATMQATADSFAAADPNGVAFSADVAAVDVAINNLMLTTSDPFMEITNRELLEAFDKEKSCEDVVDVTLF